MIDKLIISINAQGEGAYNSYIICLPSRAERMKESIGKFLEIELMTGKESLTEDGYIRYDFNVTKEKEEELTAILIEFNKPPEAEPSLN